MLVLVVADMKAEHVGGLSVRAAALLKLVSGWGEWVAGGLFARRLPFVCWASLSGFGPLLGDGEVDHDCHRKTSWICHFNAGGFGFASLPLFHGLQRSFRSGP